MPLCTRLTNRLGIEHPIVLAPMGSAAGGKLVAAVTAAGGLGLIGGGYGDPEWLEREFAQAGNARIGCGFITWSLAQGAEAGGHGVARATLTLVPEVADHLARNAPETLLLAAGGIADGRGLGAVLMLGADGVLVGSRFWASKEALVPPSFQEAAVAAQGDDTIRTTVVDVVRKLDWPHPLTARVLRTRFTTEWHGREAALAEPAVNEREMERYFEAARRGDVDNTGVFVGEAVGLINDIRAAGDFVRQMVREAEDLLCNKAPSILTLA